MPRRDLSITLLAILALQLLGGFALASVCLDPCSDGDEDTSCPPVCTFCTSCTHSKSAIVWQAAAARGLVAVERSIPDSSATPSSRREADIFHVPLHA